MIVGPLAGRGDVAAEVVVGDTEIAKDLGGQTRRPHRAQREMAGVHGLLAQARRLSIGQLGSRHIARDPARQFGSRTLGSVGALVSGYQRHGVEVG